MIDAYFNGPSLCGDLSHSVRESLSKWARVCRWTDPIGEKHWMVELNRKGRHRAEEVMQKRGHDRIDHGVAIERPAWEGCARDRVSPEGFVGLADRAGVPAHLREDWRDATRVIIVDLEQMVRTLSVSVEWEQHRDTDRLIAEGWSDEEVDAWLYLDRPEVRSSMYQLSYTHLIIWG